MCIRDSYVNGQRIARRDRPGGLGLDDIALPRDLAGVELHLGPDGPVDEECGALLLWLPAVGAPEANFRGTLEARISGARRASIIAARLEPGGLHYGIGPDGTVRFDELLPGDYDVVFISQDGEIGTQSSRVYADVTSVVTLQVNELDQPPVHTTMTPHNDPGPMKRAGMDDGVS